MKKPKTMGTKIKKEELIQGDILLYHGKALLSRAIRFFDGTDYNHASVYIGNNKVIEAVSQGVIIAEVEKSIRGQRILIKRLDNRPQNMQPVVEVANSYVGTRYAYEQLLLLVLITTTRRVRTNVFLLRFVNKLLEKAISVILKITSGDKKALVCSELVYRSFDEVLPPRIDAYSINLSRKNFESRKDNKLISIDNESLIDKYYGVGNSFNNKLSPSPFIELSNIENAQTLKTKFVNEKSNDDFENDLEKLFEDVVSSYKNEDYTMSIEEGHVFKKNMDIFMTLNYEMNNKGEDFTTSTKVGDILDVFIRDNANFVTPGDLYKANNLIGMGTLS